MVTRKQVSVFFVLLCIQFCAYSLDFRHLTVDDGLPQMSINAIEKDTSGYMWFGTADGLSRFDGYDFVTIPYVPNQSSLLSNTITSLSMADNNILWIGTAKGISRINTEDLSILPPLDIEPDKVLKIIRDRETLWVLQYGRISGFINNKCHTTISIENEDIWAMAIIETGVWLTTDKNLYFYSFKTQSITLLESINELVDLIYVYSNDELLLATLTGLVQFNVKTRHFKRFSYGNFDQLKNSGDINFIEKQPNGHIWLGIWNQGVYELDQDLKVIYLYKNIKNDPGSLANNEPLSIYFDSDLIWIGNQGGGINLLWERARFLSQIGSKNTKSGLSHPLVRSIGESENALLVGTSDGLNKITSSSYGEITSELATINGDCSTENRAISAIKSLRDKRIFVATTGAGRCFLFEYDPQLNELNALTHAAELKPIGGNQIVELDDGNKLLLTVDGIFQFSDDFIQQNPAFKPLDGQVVWVGMQDRQGRIWFGTHSEGIYLFSPKYELLAHFKNQEDEITSLSSNYVKSFLQDSKGNIWVGTVAGLNLFDELSQTFSVITQNEGLSNNTIYGILEDEHGALWLSTNKGINRFNLTNQTIWQLTTADGLQSTEFNTGAYFKQKSGKLVFGGINGINILTPSKLSPKLNNQKIRISQLELSSDEHQVGQTFNVHDSDFLELNHQNTRTQITISSLDFINQNRVQYAYQLLGLSEKWFTLPVGENILSFSTLSAGSYQLVLKSRNSDGLWSEPQIKLKLKVIPAPWLTPWAYGAYFVLLIFVLCCLYYWRINTLRKRQIKLEELILERTETINQQAQVLVLQNEVLQKAITEKDNVFAHVTHEFKTPLTLVLNPIKSLMDSATETQISMLELIERNSYRLNYLVDQLVGFSEIHNKALSKVQEVVSFNRTLKLYLSDFAAIFREKNINVKVNMHEEFKLALPISILDLVLSNIISNAVKYCSNEGDIQINIIGDTAEHCLLSISNTHPRLSDEQLRKMFERFYRVPIHQSFAPGTGLGLALVKDALALYNCKIVAKNVPMAIEIVMSLPIASTPETKVPNNSNRQISTIRHSLPRQHIEIKSTGDSHNDLPLLLVIEDDPDMRLLLHSVLTEHFELLIYSQPEEAIAATVDQLPDVILLDYMLPELNGDEVTARLRSNVLSCHIPILILTAKSDKQTRLLNMRALVDDIMAKPFDTEELLTRLFSLIEIRQLLSKKQQHLYKKEQNENVENEIEQQFRLKLTDVIQQHYADTDFDILKLANLLGVSERQLQRKCKSTLDISPKSFIRDYRLIQAKEKLLQGEQITRVGFDCGFSSSAYFTQCFRAYFGYPPSETKKRGSPTR
jgi:signal transduction histidine kinase/ligand-binding sensor domain-containing protein/DNA-binding response OmpR family regulator